jgi:hypothetical protein
MPGGWSTLLFLAVVVFVFVAGATVLVFGAAYLLRVACRGAGVPQPDMDQAIFVSCVEAMLGLVILLSCRTAVELYVPIDTTRPAALVGLLAVGLAFVVAAGVYVPTVRVTFRKGMLIASLRYSITLSLLTILRFLLVLACNPTQY